MIARSYLEAVDELDENSEYIGRATMDNLERMLKDPDIKTKFISFSPSIGKLQKYVTQQQNIIEDKYRDKL